MASSYPPQMNPDQNVVINDKLNSIQKSVDRIDDDLAHDREELGETRLRLAAVEGEVHEMRKLLSTVVSKAQDQIAETIAPLQEQIENKKIIEYRKPWYKFWR